MGYITRHLERKFAKMSGFFKAVLVTGARQVGKTTMLRHFEQGRTYVTLDDHMVRDLANRDPALFFQTYKPPVIIDEVQYAPGLFSHLKMLCDGSGESGLFWLTGSQQYEMMKNVRETLAGRIGILQLYAFRTGKKKGFFLMPIWIFLLTACNPEKRKRRKTMSSKFLNISGVAVCRRFFTPPASSEWSTTMPM